MKSFIKTIGLIMFAVLLFPITTGAQTQGAGYQDEGEDSVSGFGLVDGSLYVSRTKIQSVSLEKNTFYPGEIVKGTFELKNISSEADAGISYRVELANQYDKVTGIYENIFDIQELGTISLNPGQTKTVGFEYTLPQVSGDGYAVSIALASSGGIPMGWIDTPISISGDAVALLEISEEFVRVNSNVFDIQEGPTVKEGDNASYNISLINNSDQDVLVTPIFAVAHFGHSKSKTPLSYPEIMVPAEEAIVLEYDLSELIQGSGVYTADYKLVDKDGLNRIPFTSVRFISGQSSATIKDISTDVTSGNKGDVVIVSLGVTGTPLDITSDLNEANSQLVDVEVVLYDEIGELAGEGALEVDLSKESSLVIPVTLIKKTRALSALVKVVENGNIIAEKTLEISGDYNDLEDDFNMALLVTIVVLSLTAIIVGLLYKKHAESVSTTLTLLLLLAAGLIFPFIPTSAEAWTVSRYKPYEGGFTFNGTTNIGSDDFTVESGEDIVVSGTAYTIRCSNKTAYARVTFKMKSLATGLTVDEYENVYSIPGTGGNTKSYYGKNLGYIFKGGQPDGLYKVTVDVYGRDNNGRETGFVYTQYVQVGTTSVSFSANPVAVVQGESSTLSWQTVNIDGCLVTDGVGTEYFRSDYYDTNRHNREGYASDSGSLVVTPMVTTTYTIQCTNAEVFFGTATEYTDSLTIGVMSTPLPPVENPQNAPTVDISVEENPVDWNTPAHVIWTTTDADSCEFTEGLSGSVDVNGDEFTSNLTEDATITLSCTNSSGTTVESVNVAVTSPTVSLSVVSSPTTTTLGGSVSITWAPFANGSSVMADTVFDSCVASGNWSGSKNPAGGTESVTPNTQPESVFTVTCAGPYGQANGSAYVAVSGGDGGGEDDGSGGGGDDGDDSGVDSISCGAFQSGNQIVKANINTQIQWSVDVMPQASYTYEWIEGGEVIGTSSTVNAAYSNPGTKSVHVDISNAGGVVGTCDASVVIQKPQFEEF